MWKSVLLGGLLVGGCATWPGYSGEDTDLRLMVARSEADLRGLVLDLADPAAVIDVAPVVDRLDAARVAVGARTALAFDGGGAGSLLAVGVVLKICRDGVVRISGMEDRAAALRFARGEFAVGCLVPLAVVGFRGSSATRGPAGGLAAESG